MFFFSHVLNSVLFFKKIHIVLLSSPHFRRGFWSLLEENIKVYVCPEQSANAPLLQFADNNKVQMRELISHKEGGRLRERGRERASEYIHSIPRTQRLPFSLKSPPVPNGSLLDPSLCSVSTSDGASSRANGDFLPHQLIYSYYRHIPASPLSESHFYRKQHFQSGAS